MTSPYLNRPLLPLGAALSRMLENIEAELTRGARPQTTAARGGATVKVIEELRQ
jgi:hypothetical protein